MVVLVVSLMSTRLTIMRNAYIGLMNYRDGLSGTKLSYWAATLIALRTGGNDAHGIKYIKYTGQFSK